MQNIKTAQHTNRPWNYTVAHKSVAVHPCHFYFEGNVDDSVLADAALIAAAPELLEALQYAVEKYGKEGGPWNVPSDPGGWLERSRAAIEKATGGQKP